MFNHIRAKLALFKAKKFLRSARIDSKQVGHVRAGGDTLSSTGLKYYNSAQRKRLKAYDLVSKSRKLRRKE